MRLHQTFSFCYEDFLSSFNIVFIYLGCCWNELNVDKTGLGQIPKKWLTIGHNLSIDKIWNLSCRRWQSHYGICQHPDPTGFELNVCFGKSGFIRVGQLHLFVSYRNSTGNQLCLKARQRICYHAKYSNRYMKTKYYLSSRSTFCFQEQNFIKLIWWMLRQILKA